MGAPRARGPMPKVVYQCPGFVVIDKPAGMLSAAISEASRELSAFDFVKQLVRGRRPGPRAWIIHRLDREVSGLMVFATTPEAYESLKTQLKSRDMHRTYLGVVHGEFADAAKGAGEPRVIRSDLIESARGRVMIPEPGARVTGRALPAITHYVPLASAGGKTLVRVKLQTGRKHQIRVHLASEQHALVGDNLYGPANDEPRIWLHAEELAFKDPGTGKQVRFKSQAPARFYDAVGLQAPESRSPAVVGVETAVPKPTDESWDHVADWYNSLWESDKGDLFRDLVLPGTLRMLALRPGENFLDAACGGGQLCNAATLLGAHCVGVDLSPSLIDQARSQFGSEFHVGDARDLLAVLPAESRGNFDAAACVLALMNIDPIGPVFRGVFECLKPGGRMVALVLHPAFRSPRTSSWGWAGEGKSLVQYRRVDGYKSARPIEITMNPGGVSSGAKPITTMTYHRPIEVYVNAACESGLVITGMEEWISPRVSQPGPRAESENRARSEIPMFLAMQLRRPSNG